MVKEGKREKRRGASKVCSRGGRAGGMMEVGERGKAQGPAGRIGSVSPRWESRGTVEVARRL